MTDGATPTALGARTTEKRDPRKIGIIILGVLAGIVLLIVIAVTAYDAGHSSARGALDCKREAVILALQTNVKRSGDAVSIDRQLRLGDCARVSDDAFKAAITVLDHTPVADANCPTSSSTTTSSTPTVIVCPTKP